MASLNAIQLTSVQILSSIVNLYTILLNPLYFYTSKNIGIYYWNFIKIYQYEGKFICKIEGGEVRLKRCGKVSIQKETKIIFLGSNFRSFV